MRPTQQRVRSQTQSRTTTNAVQRAKMRAKRRAKMLAGARWQAMTGDEREAATLASAKRDHAVHEHGGDHHRGRCKPPLSTAAQSTTEPADQTGLPGWVGWNDPATQRHWPRPQPAVPPTQPQYPGAEGVEPHGQQAAVASAEPHAADTQRSALHRAMTVEAQHYTAAAGGHQVAIAEELGHIDEDQVPHGQQAAAASAKPHAADTQRSAPAQPQSVDHHHGAVVVEAQHYTAATGEHQVTAAEELNHIDIDEEHVLQAIARIRAGEIQSTAPWDRRYLSEWGNTELASFLREGQWKLLKAAARACWNRANGGLRHHTKDFEACLDCFRGAVDEASETGDEEGIEEQQRLLDDLIAYVLVEAEQGTTEEGPTAAQHTTAKTRSTAEVQSQPAEGHIEGHIAAEAQQARCGITATVGHAAHAARSLTADETHHGSEGVTSEAIQDHATDETHRDAMGFGVDGDCSEGVTGEAAQDHATDGAHCGSGDSDVGGPVYTCVDCKWPHPASSFSETQLRRARRELSCRCRGCASVKHARHRASQQVAASQNPYHVPGRQCAVCGETFASRNKLFAHLRGSGHGATTQPRCHADGATEADADSGAAEPIHAADAPDRPRQGGQTIGAAAADRKGNAQLFHVPYISPQQASDAHHAAGTQRSATAQSQHHAAGTQRSATAQSQFTDAHSYAAAAKAELYLPVLRWLQQRSATGLAQPTEAEIQNWCHSWLRQRDSRAQPPLAKGPEPPGQHHAATNRPRQPQPAKGQGRATEMQRDAVAYAENKYRTAAAGVQHNTEARHQAAAQLPANEAEARHARTADGDGGEFHGPQSPSERRGHGQQQSYQNGGVNQVMQQAPAQMTKLAESAAEMASENAKLNSQVRELRVQLEGLEDTKAALGTVRAVLNEERSKRQKAENEVRHAKQQLDSLQQKFLGVLREKDNETEKRMLALESKFAQAKKGAKKLLKDQEEARRQEVREMEDRFRRQLEVPRQKQKRLEEEIKRLQLQLTEMMKGAPSARKTFKTMEREAMILQQEKKLLGGKTAEATSQIQGMQDKHVDALDSTMELWIQQLENEVQFVRELHALGDEKEAAAAAALAAEKEAAAAAQAKADTEAAVEACRDATTQQLITQLDAKREMALTRAYRDAEEEQGTALTTPQIQHDAADHPRQGGQTVQHELQPRMKNPRAHHHIVTSQTRDAQSDASSRSAGAMSQRHAAQSQAQPPTTSTEERNRAAVSSSVGNTQGHSDRLTLAARHIQFELSSLDVASVGSAGHHRTGTTTNAGAQHHLAAVDVRSQAGSLGEADTDEQQHQPPWPPPMHPAHAPIPQWHAPLTQVPMSTPWYNSPAPWYPPPWVPPPWRGIPSTPWGFPPWVPWHVSPMMPGRNSPTQRAPQAQYHATAALPRSAQPQATSQHRAGETRSSTGAVTDETEGHRAEMRDTTQNAAGGQCQVTAPARTPPSGGAPAPWRHADGITKADTNSDAAELIHAAGMRTQRSPKAQTPPHEGHSRTAAAVARHRAATNGGQPCTERPHRTAAVVESGYKANFIGGQPKSTGSSAQIVLLPAEVRHHPTANRTQRHRESISPTQPSGGAQVLVPSSGRDGRVYPNITEVQPQRMPQDAELPNSETTGMHTAQQCNYASRDGPRGCPGPPGNARNQTALHVGCHSIHGCPGPPLQHVRHVYIASTSTVLQATCGTGASR